MRLPGDAVVLHFGVKRTLDLLRRPAELDPSPALRHPSDGEPFAFEPCANLLRIRFGGSEPGPKLGRAQPTVIIRRSLPLLLVEQLLEFPLLLCRGPQHQDHSLEACVCFDASKAVSGGGQWMPGVSEPADLPVVNRRADAAWLLGVSCGIAS